MNTRISLRAVALVGLVSAGAVWVARRPGGAPEAAAERGSDPGLLLDRVWVDSKPEKYTDFTHAMLALGGAPIGLFQKASAYQATTEIFEYKRRDAVLGVHFPQTGKKREVRFRIHECSDLPPFDLCLDLSQNPWGGPRRYYGLTDPDQERARLGVLRHQLEHLLAGAGHEATH